MNHEHCEAQNVFHTRMGYMKSWEVVQSFQKFFFFFFKVQKCASDIKHFSFKYFQPIRSQVGVQARKTNIKDTNS